jgi:tetratricopeptide (TPR) repeat protein
MPLAKPPQSAASALALGAAPGAVPTERKAAGGVVGHAGAPDVMARLNAAVAELKQIQARPLLQQAVTAIEKSDFNKGCELAIKALEIDEANGYGWYLLAIARESLGDFRNALECYDAALKLMPSETDVANDLGRLAARLGMMDLAEKLFRVYLQDHPENTDTLNNLASVVRDLGRDDEAIDILKASIMAFPETAVLWSTLGSVLAERGDNAEAIVFYDEACRLDPKGHKAFYNRGLARLPLGDLDGALADCERALKHPMPAHETAMMNMARGTMLLTSGRVGEGWDGYENRLSQHYVDSTQFIIDRPTWTPETDVAGKFVLVYGEQGLGDEVLFANVLPDLIEAIGPEGRLAIAVEPRLIPLFQRSFPSAQVGGHSTHKLDGYSVRGAPFVTDAAAVDYWVPIASLLRRYRRTVDAFPPRERFLSADDARVAHWRKVLDEAAPAGLKVGVLWKSLKTDPRRMRHFSPFDQWKSVLQTPGATFVNMQYGDCTDELAQAKAELGIDIWQPPGLDLKNDLDEVAALSVALDLMIGPPNATTNISAACGGDVWLIGTPGAWPRLGTDRYPWYPQVRAFVPERFNDWEPVMADVAAALAQRVG